MRGVLDVKTGEVRALVGGYDFQISKFNRAIQSRRQTGSSFKPFVYGAAFEKGLTFKGGQTHTQRFMPELLQHIEQGRLKRDVIVSHRMPLEEAARGYELFNDKKEECRKVVLTPGR